MKIEDVMGREVLDSRGNPTVEVEIVLDTGITGRFSVPSGASTGTHEALELRDNDKRRYYGKGVTKAVSNVNRKIKPKLIGENPVQQKVIDDILIRLDGKPNKSRLGANAILATSVACAKAAAASLGLQLHEYIGGLNARLLPVPMFNIMNGGVHADSGLDIQEFMIMPVGAKNIRHAVRIGSEIFHCLKDILKSNGLATSVGDEGGFAPKVSSNEEALTLIVEAIKKAKYEPRKDVCIALDVAANELCKDKKRKRSILHKGEKDKKYTLSLKKDFKDKPAKDLIKFYDCLIKKFPIISIEDGMAEDDLDGWKLLTKTLGSRIQIVGDDLFVTNVDRLQDGIKRGIANSIIIKPNQIGTLSETLWVVEVAKRNNYTCVVANRSAETGEPFLASLSVACNTGQIKAGSVCRGERIANYNELMRIEEYLGNIARYGGWPVSHNLKNENHPFEKFYSGGR